MPKTAERLSRHEKAGLLGLTLEARVTANEGDLDTLEDAVMELSAAIRWQNRALASGIVSIMAVLLGAVLFK